MSKSILIIKDFYSYVFSNFNKSISLNAFLKNQKISKYIFKKCFNSKEEFAFKFFTYFYNVIIKNSSEEEQFIIKFISLPTLINKFYNHLLLFLHHKSLVIKETDELIFNENLNIFFSNFKEYLKEIYPSKYLKVEKTIIKVSLFIDICLTNIKLIINYYKNELDLVDSATLKANYLEISSYINEIIKSTTWGSFRIV